MKVQQMKLFAVCVTIELLIQLIWLDIIYTSMKVLDIRV